ncbi:hypothetical protein PR202_ga21995 [Eleusine coracana subsp. coracana]|uniref:Uncharacterized protein n=1 Tax=Eleusine coracana subsp. coracana TaxID=191504 RepID=A0AAV5D1V8_ELECO|nr:hypothetical protein PR202_ga21995 [Eleusine coracana subsp. coracana]
MFMEMGYKRRCRLPGRPTIRFHPKLIVRALEATEARHPHPRQCRYCPEGHRYPLRTLKEKLRYVPDNALIMKPLTSATTPMDSNPNAVSNDNVGASYLNNIELLNEANFLNWKGKVITCLAWNDLDVALRVDKPAPPADGAAPSTVLEKWDRSNRMATMVMLQTISAVCCGAADDILVWTLKEKLRCVPDNALIIKPLTSAPTPMESNPSADTDMTWVADCHFISCGSVDLGASVIWLHSYCWPKVENNAIVSA